MTSFLFVLLAAADAGPVVVIGLDGFSAEALRSGKVKTPNLQRLMDVGSWSLHARGVMPTVSSPNWASIIMGAGPEHHGVTSNEWQPFNFDIAPVCKGSADIFPTIFGQLRAERGARVKTAAIHDWKDFGRLFERKAVDEARHVLGSPQAADAAIKYFQANRPDFLFIHFDDVDHAGHNHGWHGERYYAEVVTIDGLIGKVIDAVDLKRTAVFIVADHGGVGTKHGGLSMVELEVPWIAAGKGVPKLGEMKGMVNSLDTAPTVAGLMRIRPHACWTGRDLFRR